MKENRVKNHSPSQFCPLFPQVLCLPQGIQLLMNPSRDALCTYKNTRTCMYFLFIYLILVLEINGSKLCALPVSCFSHLPYLRVHSIISRQCSARLGAQTTWV